MAYQTKPNTGSAFKNDRENSKAIYSGELNVDGVLYFIDLYNNKANNGNKYIGIRIKKKDKQGTTTESGESKTPTNSNDFEDDLPF